MAGIQTIKVNLQRDSLQTPWGFRLQGGADFCTPFTVNKITAGSPADGVLHRGDVILEIDQRPTNPMLHAEALDLIQRAGGQVTFIVQRGPSPLASLMQNQRSISAMPWSLANATSYLDKNFNAPWSPSATPLSPSACYRSRALERVPQPKPILSQTGSPLMPGPVPSVSTKTRGYIKPPTFHTEPSNIHTPPVDASFSPHFTFPTPYNTRNQTVSTTTFQQQTSHQSPAWKDSLNNDANTYIPSYQKNVPTQRQNSNQHNKTVSRQQHQQQYNYRPASVQPPNLVHHQYNSPMGLYSNDSMQNAMKSHVSHISHVSITPSVPKPPHGTYTIALTPSSTIYTTASTPICYVKPRNTYY